MISIIFSVIFGYSILLRFFFDLGITVAPIHQKLINSGILQVIVGYFLLNQIFSVSLSIFILFIFYIISIFSIIKSKDDDDEINQQTFIDAFGTVIGRIFYYIAFISKPTIFAFLEELGYDDEINYLFE